MITLLASGAIILLSFVSEDAATISSALSVFGGPLSWPVGFASCFAGIWLGDLGLYSLARWTGKNLLYSEWLPRFANPVAIRRCKETFARNSAFALIASRFIPGTRLVTYLAAGLFRVPLQRFASITAIGAFVWIGGIFALTKFFGAHALVWFTLGQNKTAAVVVTSFAFFVILIVGRNLVRAVVAGVGDPGSVQFIAFSASRDHRSRLQLSAFGRRCAQWEFWPAWLFYIPVAAYYFLLAIRYRSLTLPTAANPGMENGGFVGESKSDILKQIQKADSNLVADGYRLEGQTISDRLLSLHRLTHEHKISLPFILKPDVGQRGNGVRLIKSMREALDYLLQFDKPVILQRYASGEYEIGVLYFRFPHEKRGRIFAITEKIFPTIMGDGTSTIAQLIRADDRASLIASKYLERFADREDEILPAGVSLKLVETGNHAQGCIFQDGGHLWSEGLDQKIDSLSRRLPGFYFGRFDIRCENEGDLRAGSFKIVELNGASSEATNIYDARNSLRDAYQILFLQWRLVFAIGAANRARGFQPSRLRTLWREWRQCCAAASAYPCAS